MSVYLCVCVCVCVCVKALGSRPRSFIGICYFGFLALCSLTGKYTNFVSVELTIYFDNNTDTRKIEIFIRPEDEFQVEKFVCRLRTLAADDKPIFYFLVRQNCTSHENLMIIVIYHF